MKTALLLVGLLISTVSWAQQVIANDNSFSATVDGKEFKTQPRRIRIGQYWWITANATKPDKSLRIWFVDFDNNSVLPKVGKYLVVGEKESNKSLYKKTVEMGTYVGVAVMKYVEETKEPRMEFHVGNGIQENTGVVEVIKSSDGFMEAKFSAQLEGTYYKEKATATVFGGAGRLIGKMTDKAKTSATGYDYDIDPEGNGYKKQDTIDKIVVQGTFKLKLGSEEK
ncbi:MAG: hypothetical protein U0Y10_03870 [Spirosomataceae bacterium]